MNDTLVLFSVAIILLILLYVFYNLLTRKSSGPEWKNVAKQNLITTLKTSDYKSALIELDKLLDYCLKNKKLEGETLGERLKNAKGLYEKREYNSIWEAHKQRNALVHQVNYRLDNASLKQHINTLKKAVEELV